MLLKIFFKEWKEKSLIFVLAVIFLLGLILVRFYGRQDLLMYMSGMFVWLFLPFAALMVGSSGFYSEHKDNAWIYLFSRPVKKRTIWLMKYLTQLSVLLAIYLIFFLLFRLLPGMEDVAAALSFTQEESLYSISYSLLFSVAAFSIAFALSILHDKQFIIFLVSILLGVGIIYLLNSYQGFLRSRYFAFQGLKGIQIFLALSFVMASILTFIKCDFSQFRKKVYKFSGFLIVFLLVTVLLSTGWTVARWHWRGQDYMLGLQGKNADAYFRTKKGMYKYREDQDKIIRLENRFRSSISSEEDKLVFSRYVRIERGNIRWYSYELWVMNADGTHERPLISTSSEDFPRRRDYLRSFQISPDATKVAFITRDFWERNWTVWTINLDGTGLNGNPFTLDDVYDLDLVGWVRGNESLVLTRIPSAGNGESEKKLVLFDLQDGKITVLAGSLRRPGRARISSGEDIVAYVYFDEKNNKEVLALFDVTTSSALDVCRAATINNFKWSRDGTRIAYLSEGDMLGLYSLKDRMVLFDARVEIDLDNRVEIPLGWVFDDQKIILLAYQDGRPHLQMFSRELIPEKQIKFPLSSVNVPVMVCLDRVALVQILPGPQLWRIDFQTENWKKLY